MELTYLDYSDINLAKKEKQGKIEGMLTRS